MFPLAAAFKSFGLLLLTYVLIFSGVAFMNRQLLPDLLEGLYDRTGTISRLIIFTVALSLPANFLTAKAYEISGPSIAGPLIVASMLLIALAFALMVDHVNLNLPVIASALAALFFCGLTAWLLESQKLGK